MSSLYPEETKRLDVISHLEELRRRILYCLLAVAVVSAASFLRGNDILSLVREPVSGLVDELIFIGPTEAFVAYLKVCILAGFILSFPVILYNLWAFLGPAFPGAVRKRMAVWLAFALALFFAGCAFSFFVAVPAALKFLIGFSSEIASPKLTLGKYISFFGALMVIGGVTFEIPIIIGLLADTGIVSSGQLRAKRHYAVLAIMVFAAVITPTQDILNMLLFGLPMLLLYELGIIIASIIERRRKTSLS